VGNTRVGTSSRVRRPVHPHACGEHGEVMSSQTTAIGSSPRMWGTRPPFLCAVLSGRFIPTHVGNTGCMVQILGCCSVHPHACGEHVPVTSYLPGGYGSSPRMWGTPNNQGKICFPFRFIPTHVGNTRFKRINFTGNTVHPHACGEHILSKPFDHFFHGSSPRMWGTLLLHTLYLINPRFIPTHVGNT